MKGEGQTVEKKSLSAIAGGKADFDVIARECVGFANARGGHLHIGIEDDADQPPDAQRIDDSLLETLQKRIPQLTHNVIIAPVKVTAANGGEYIDLVFSPTQHIACTSDGRYFLRVGDDRVTVIIRKRIIKTDVVDFVAKADESFQLTQRERVALGLIAQHESLTAINLSSLLALKSAEDLKYWIGRLQKLEWF